MKGIAKKKKIIIIIIPKVKIRIQIPMILKTIDTPKSVSQHLE